MPLFRRASRREAPPPPATLNPEGPFKQGASSAFTAFSAVSIGGPAAQVVLGPPAAVLGFAWGMLKGYGNQAQSNYGDVFEGPAQAK